ncbi:MAG: TlpA disulfide reductase family protein [Cyclobacteriaceae bacterium]|jgi:thiol-disulfide isomerase/thioredoxin|nr:TlpA disulfide reductase family protein [Cyclobacteriaceae bacterium]
MKTPLTKLSTFLVAILFLSCSKEQKDMKINIEAIAIDSAYKQLRINTFDLVSYQPTLLDSVLLDSAGNGKISIDIKQPTFAYYDFNTISGLLILEPGYKLQMKLANNNIAFYGEGAEANNFLNRIKQIQMKYESLGGLYYWEMPDEIFEARLDSLEKETKIFTDYYFDSVKVSPKLEEVLKQSVNYHTISLRQAKLTNNYELDSITFEQKKEQIHSRIKFDHKMVELGLLDYGAVMNSYLELEVYKNLPQNINVIEADSIQPLLTSQAIKQLKLKPKELELIMARNVEYWMSLIGTKPSVKIIYNDFKKIFPQSMYQTVLEKHFNKWQKIEAGNIAPDFAGITPTGDTVKLSQLKGKKVYIDVWATWCGPCRQEFPYSIKLKEKLKNTEDIVFLYVSVDESKTAWEKFLQTDEAPKGLHIWQPKPTILEYYLIAGIPRYILIDENGIIKMVDAPRPSSGKVLFEIINNSKEYGL